MLTARDSPAANTLAERLTLKWRSGVPQLLRFLFVGGLNTGIGIGLIWLNMTLLGLTALVANAVAYATMLPISLWTFSRAVFDYFGQLRKAIFFFMAIYGIATICNLGVVALLTHETGLNVVIVQLAGMCTYLVVYYPMNRWLFAALKRRSHH